jgi:enamine deaminase RidA (YjgF/YER057c/UK114 family)
VAPMAIERFGSGGPFEARVGYCRVVRAGEHVWVSGCTAITEDGVVAGAGDAYVQARAAIGVLVAALARAGAGPEHVVRTRMFVTDVSRWEEVARAHQEVFGAAPPAAAMLGVSALLDPRMLVEIEADAFVAGGTSSA